jgi:hypothetical protein
MQARGRLHLEERVHAFHLRCKGSGGFVKCFCREKMCSNNIDWRALSVHVSVHCCRKVSSKQIREPIASLRSKWSEIRTNLRLTPHLSISEFDCMQIEPLYLAS